MATISAMLGKKIKWVLLTVAFLTLVDNGAVDISVAQAQSFKRVYQNGVIYYYFSIRGEVGQRQVYFKSRENKRIGPATGRKMSPQELEPVVEEASRHYNLPPALIKAMIQVESNFVQMATSPKGAQGLMQLMPDTANQLQVRNAYDVRENIWAGTRYLYMMLEKFGYSLPLALAAYNAGPQRVEQYQNIPPIKETQGFVRDVCVSFLKHNR